MKILISRIKTRGLYFVNSYLLSRQSFLWKEQKNVANILHKGEILCHKWKTPPTLLQSRVDCRQWRTADCGCPVFALECNKFVGNSEFI